MRLGIIGTAGRNDQPLTREHMRFARRSVMDWMQARSDEEFVLVSGGSAWMDHVAVQLFLRGRVDGLVLCLPAKLGPDGRYENTAIGRRLNQLHLECQRVSGYPVFDELARAVADEQTIIHYGATFQARNKKIAQLSDHLLAFTFGIDAPDSAGTLNTWKQVTRSQRTHISLLTETG